MVLLGIIGYIHTQKDDVKSILNLGAVHHFYHLLYNMIISIIRGGKDVEQVQILLAAIGPDQALYR